MKVSERSIMVTVCASFALALCAVYKPWFVVVLAAVFAAPFVYLRVTWKRDMRKRRTKFYD